MPPVPSPAPSPGRPPRVAIIGTGFGGVATAIRLLQDGVHDVRMLERFEDTGGTWRDNTYPGAACDIPSHLYSLADEPNPDWSRHYAPQPEIRAYLDRVVAKHGLRERTTFGFDVRRAVWDDPSATWTLTAADGREVTSDVLVNASGGLKDPKHPAIHGLEDFGGPVLHSARWDHDVELTGRRIGSIGTGASAIQLVPELAERASELTVFQRTPPWIIPRLDRAFTAAEQFAFRNVPGARAAFRRAIFLEHELFHKAFQADHPLNRVGEGLARTQLRRQVRDPRLREELTPDDAFGCKRVLRSDDYYPALTRDHVTVATTDVERITADGVVLTDGRRVDLDVLVLCTGFTVDDPLHGTEVIGRDGRDLDEFWDGRPSAHLSTAVPGFPNAFMVLGPNAGLGHNSAILMIEAAVGYIADAIAKMRQRDIVALEVAEFVHEDFVRWIDDELASSSWAEGCASWYLNDRGENFTVWPGTVGSYQEALAEVDLSDYVIRRRTDQADHSDDTAPRRTTVGAPA